MFCLNAQNQLCYIIININLGVKIKINIDINNNSNIFMWITINTISLNLDNNWSLVDENDNPPYCLIQLFLLTLCRSMLKTNICSTTKYANTVRIFLFAIFGFEISYLWALDLLSRSGKWRYMEEPVLQSRPSRQSVLWFGRDQFMSQKGLFLAVWLIYKKQEKNGNNLRHLPIAVLQ